MERSGLNDLKANGLIAYQRRDYASAERYLRQALHADPRDARVHYLLGNILREKGEPDKAVIHYRESLRLDPQFAEAYNNLGLVLQEKGQLDEAMDCYRKALEIDPSLTGIYYNLGTVFQDKKDFEQAMLFYRKAIEDDPHDVDAHYNLANVLRETDRLDDALAHYQTAFTLNPELADAYANVGMILHARGLFDDAIASYRRALQLDPNMPDTYNNIGSILYEKKQLDEAVEYFQKALQLNPDFADAYINLGAVSYQRGHLDDAVTYYKKGLSLKPDSSHAHLNLSLILLTYGDFNNGWKEYEWRLRKGALSAEDFSQALWDGSDIRGKTILLYAEHGLGDAIQFIRYVPLVVSRGAEIVVLCQRELASLFQNIEGIKQVIGVDGQLPLFDIHCPLSSLPLKFNTTIDTIPAQIPYIKADPFLIQKWRDKLLTIGSKFKVGLVWAGNPSHRNDSNRSFSRHVCTACKSRRYNLLQSPERSGVGTGEKPSWRNEFH